MKITVRRKSGHFVIKSDRWREDRVYDPAEILRLGAPRIPRHGESLTFEMKEVDSRNA